MTMDARKQRVLQAIVALYGLEGEPVGSSVLANYFDMAVSSATLRNEMAALTKLGLLEQPHTSAGRVPSAKGYRYYLDNLLTDDQPLDRVTRARVDAVFASLDHEPEKLAQGAAKALAAISGCTAAVSTPCAEDLCIAHYEVVQVGRSAAAVLAVTTAGYVRTRVARVRTGLSRENAAALAALLNRNLTFVAPVDLSTRMLSELCSQIAPELVPVVSAAAAILQDSVKPHVFLGGEQYLLDWPQLDGRVGDNVLSLEAVQIVFAKAQVDAKFPDGGGVIAKVLHALFLVAQGHMRAQFHKLLDEGLVADARADKGDLFALNKLGKLLLIFLHKNSSSSISNIVSNAPQRGAEAFAVPL